MLYTYAFSFPSVYVPNMTSWLATERATEIRFGPLINRRHHVTFKLPNHLLPRRIPYVGNFTLPNGEMFRVYCPLQGTYNFTQLDRGVLRVPIGITEYGEPAINISQARVLAEFCRMYAAVEKSIDDPTFSWPDL